MTRRTSFVVLLVAAFSLCSAALVGASSARSQAGFADGVWVDGVVHDLSTGPGPAHPTHTTPLYVISPVSAAHPLHPLAFARPLGFGAHDHVAQIPNAKAPFHGVCDLRLVVPGPKAKVGTNVLARQTLTPVAMKPLLHAARLDGELVPLDSASRIQQARRVGLATIVDTKVTIACTITPRTS
jgi:hypothetical protein